jgi:acyl carrier protein
MKKRDYGAKSRERIGRRNSSARTPRPQSVHASFLAALMALGLAAPPCSTAATRPTSAAKPNCDASPRAAIAEKIKKMLAEHLGVDRQRITEQAGIIDDLGADSLDLVEIAMAVEEALGISISDSAVEKIVTVRNLIELVWRRCTSPKSQG